MKRIKSIVLLGLCLALCARLLCSCQSNEARMEELAGTWTMRDDDTEEQARSLLEYLEFYEEELALVDLTSLDDVMLVEFDTQGNYRFAWDVEGIKLCLVEFYDQAFVSMYEGRTSLNEVYGTSFDEMTEAEFRLFYAQLYSYESYEDMLNEFVEYSYDYDSLAEDLETGTFTVKGSKIMCTVAGESEAEALGYKIEGDTLTLTFADGVQVYTRAN